MKSVFLLRLFLILCITLMNARSQSTDAYEYDRIDEVKRECSSILPADFDHKPYENQLYRLPEKLSFVNGDWWQDLDKAPLLPYDDKPDGSLHQSSPLNLISFWITDVDDAHRSKNSISVNGVLRMGLMMGGIFSSKRYQRYPFFTIYPGSSMLQMSFQGIVTYTEENNGEIVMCLLGNAVLPSRYPDSNSPWDWVKEPGYPNQPPLIPDDRILLVIHYPDKFTLKKRGIQGSLKSLNPKSSQKYFDEIHISSSLSCSATYEFTSQKLVAKVWTPDPMANKDLGTYKSPNFCRILERFLGEELPLTVVPNWRCNGTDAFCSKLGPFELKAINGSFKGVTLHLHDVRCEKASSEGGFAKVAMVIRVVLPLHALYLVPLRTGLNNLTLSAEGVWDPSSGQLCMVACRGSVDEEGDNGCNSRICLYFPLSFSIKQRSTILGSISCVEDQKSNMSYFPLAFKKRVTYAGLLRNQYYEYSRIDLAQTVLEKHERFSLETMIKTSFSTFPQLRDGKGLSLLAVDLEIHYPAVAESATGRSPSQTSLQIQILSVGQLLISHCCTLQNDSIVEEDTSYTQSQRLHVLNVSAQITLTGAQYDNFSEVLVEGLYNPLVGKMYLVGCRDVRAYNSNLLYEGTDLEDGFDCQIEVVVSYPATTNHWIATTATRVSIASQRNELDPLFFRPIKLQTIPLIFNAQPEGFEGMLQVLTPLVAIGCILSQLFYIKDNLDSIHYVSLVMLSIQALGYGFPLVRGVQSLNESDRNSYAYNTNVIIHVIDYRVKIIVLISFLLTLRLYQKVWRSRIRLLGRDLLRPRHVPSDRPVLLVTFVIHVFGFGCYLIVHKQQSWLVEMEEYLGLVQDFFLLPQIIGNLIWEIDCKPLRKSYFIGLTVIRFLTRVYGYRSSAIPYPSSENLQAYPSEELVAQYMNFFYPEKGSFGILPAISIFLAIVVHFQQKWSYETFGRIFTLGKFRLLPCWSMGYDRLLPVEAEAELNSGFSGLMKTLQRRRGWK